MKSLLLTALIFPGTTLLWAEPVITFDDLPGQQVPVPSGYHGFNWSNMNLINGPTYGLNPSGYQAGVVSAQNAIYGTGGATAVISAGMFDLMSAYATAAWNDNLQFEAKGYFQGRLLYDQTYTLSATTPTLINFNFYGVDEVDLTGSGGTRHSGYSGIGTEFVLDNLNTVSYLSYSPTLTTNGGFESGNLSGWSMSGNSNFTSVTSSSGYVHSGSYGVKAGPLAPWNLFQNMGPLQIGELYSVSCWLENPNGGTPSSFNILWGNYSIFSLTNPPAFGWTNVHVNVIASQPAQSLEISLMNGLNYFGLDDISVTPALLVSNGGFETGDFSGWTPSGNSLGDTVTGSVTAKRSGTYGASFAASGSLGFISQSLPTFSGQPYLLSLWLNSPNGVTPNRFQAKWGTQTLRDQSNMSAFGWTNIHFNVLGSATQTTLQFGLQDNSSALGLDEVSVLAVPILQNAGFEFGDFSGWTTNGDFADCSISTNSLYALKGYYGAAFGPIGAPAVISQTFATVPGQGYDISFFLDNVTNTPTTIFQATWNGTNLVALTNSSTYGWQYFEFIEPAIGATSTLQFALRDDPSFMGLDDVSVVPIAKPVFQSIVKSSKVTDLTWVPFSGYGYSIQYSTNLTNWTFLPTPLIPFTSPMTAVDTNPVDPIRFYRLLMSPVLF